MVITKFLEARLKAEQEERERLEKERLIAEEKRNRERKVLID